MHPATQAKLRIVTAVRVGPRQDGPMHDMTWAPSQSAATGTQVSRMIDNEIAPGNSSASRQTRRPVGGSRARVSEVMKSQLTAFTIHSAWKTSQARPDPYGGDYL